MRSPEAVLDDAAKLMVWACEQQLIYGDDTETREGPDWLAGRLHEPATRQLAADILTLAHTEACRSIEQRAADADAYAKALAHLSSFQERTRQALAERQRAHAAFIAATTLALNSGR